MRDFKATWKAEPQALIAVSKGRGPFVRVFFPSSFVWADLQFREWNSTHGVDHF